MPTIYVNANIHILVRLMGEAHQLHRSFFNYATQSLGGAANVRRFGLTTP